MTMDHLKLNLDLLYKHLKDINYQFDRPDTIFTPPDPSALSLLEDLFAPIPLSVKAFYLMIGGVDFMGKYPGLMTLPDDSSAHSAVLSDPLVIFPLYFDQLSYYKDNNAHDADKPFMIEISSDFYNKANISGGQGPFIALPNKNADPKVLSNPYVNHFVAYMRLNVQWGGFPGFSLLTTPEKRYEFESLYGYRSPPIPQELIDYLVKDTISF